jgi:hypothetical protein
VFQIAILAEGLADAYNFPSAIKQQIMGGKTN